MPTELAVSGAGLAGCLLAISLRRRGFDVTIYESRTDMRKETLEVHRSINLIVTSRARFAVRQLGLEDEVMGITVPVVGRAMHGKDGSVVVQPYGKDDSEKNYSVSRAELNKLLMTKAEQEGVRILFSYRLTDANLARSEFTFSDASGRIHKVNPRVMFGADGAGSVSRGLLMSHLVRNNPENIEFSTDCRAHVNHEVRRLGVSYKELLFPKISGGFTSNRNVKGYALDPNYLHIWPRGSHFLMGLPNLEGSVTGTIYLPDQAATQELQEDASFDALKDTDKAMAFLRKEYPDAVPILGDVKTQWASNPHAWLASVHVSHWVFEDKLCLIGDASHAVTPFFGQGMNCAFEDITDLNWVLDEVGVTTAASAEQWSRALRWYQQLRKAPAYDLADMAAENYQEMAAKVGDPNFLFRKQIEVEVERAIPFKFRSRYWMITNTLIPYDWVREAGRLIDSKVLDPMVDSTKRSGKVDLALAKDLVAKHITPFFAAKEIDLSSPWKFYRNRPFTLPPRL